jgi:hypothetical protein
MKYIESPMSPCCTMVAPGANVLSSIFAAIRRSVAVGRLENMLSPLKVRPRVSSLARSTCSHLCLSVSPARSSPSVCML